MSTVSRILVGEARHADDAPAAIVETLAIGSLGDLRSAAQRASEPIVWVLDARAMPSPDALEELLDAKAIPATSMPVGAQGAPLERLIGRFEHNDLESLVAAAERHRLPLRHAPIVSMLVDRSAVLELDPPDTGRFGEHAGSEWTARLFRTHPGVLVPASQVQGFERPRAALIDTLRMTRTGVWERGEALRELWHALT